MVSKGTAVQCIAIAAAIAGMFGCSANHQLAQDQPAAMEWPAGVSLLGLFVTSDRLSIDMQSQHNDVGSASDEAQGRQSVLGRPARVLEMEGYFFDPASLVFLSESDESQWGLYEENRGTTACLELDLGGVMTIVLNGAPDGGEAVKVARRFKDRITVHAVASPTADPTDLVRSGTSTDGQAGALRLVFDKLDNARIARRLRLEIIEPRNGFAVMVTKTAEGHLRVFSARPIP